MMVLVSAVAAALAAWLVVPDPLLPRRRLADPGRPSPLSALGSGVPGGLSGETRRRLALAAGAMAGAIGAGLGALWWALVLGPPVALVGWVVSGRLVSPAVRRRQARLRADLPAALDLMASCLAAGLPVRGAAAAVADAVGGPVGQDLDRVLAQVAIGDAESRAWSCLRDEAAWSLVARDLARSVESGTALVAMLRSHAERARKERHAALQERARAVGVRSVLPLMACYLPAFILVGIVPIIAGTLPAVLG